MAKQEVPARPSPVNPIPTPSTAPQPNLPYPVNFQGMPIPYGASSATPYPTYVPPPMPQGYNPYGTLPYQRKFVKKVFLLFLRIFEKIFQKLRTIQEHIRVTNRLLRITLTFHHQDNKVVTHHDQVATHHNNHHQVGNCAL